MSNPNKPRRRPVNNKGRNKFGPSFVMLESWLLRSDAYRSLKALPRAVYTELKRRFNGRNNGDISLSLREIVGELRCSKTSASNALKELVEKGLIRQNQPGSFHYKLPHAPTWILTELPFEDEPATKDFLYWKVSKKEDHGPSKRTDGPKIETGSRARVVQSQRNVLYLGQAKRTERGSRS